MAQAQERCHWAAFLGLGRAVCLSCHFKVSLNVAM